MFNMKTRFTLLLILVVYLSGCVEEYSMPGYSAAYMPVSGKGYTTEIYHDKINRVTEWRISSGKPPIDKSKAYDLAFTTVVNKFPSIVWKERVTELEFTDEGKGYYVVTLINSENKRELVILYVLMTGEVSELKSAEQHTSG